tara:strand:+ start:1162 stop:1530 length:369 start_codon:yes stop_codon:yes gene_type:complete
MKENKISDYLELKITQKMIDDYAEASKDFNPIHIDEEFASKSIFKTRIAHGMLTLSVIMEYLYDLYSEKMLQNTLFEARLKNPVYSEEKIKIYIEEKSKEKINIVCKKHNGDEAVSASLLFK